MLDQYPKIKSALVPALSGLIPALILLAVYAAFGMHPFGEKSILIMDMSDQYVDFFAGLRDIFTGEGSIFFSWSKAMGGSYIGVFSYYVSSPLSVITLLFPRDMMPSALMILTILKLGLAGLSMCLYLGYTFEKKGFWTVIFSVLYATMSYGVTYSLSVMWLDGLIWLPMVLMGLERLIRTDRMDHLLISLILSIISSYYISYMICIFSILYFLYRMAAQKEKVNFFKKLLRFALAGMGAVAFTAWLWLPSLFSLMQGRVSSFVTMPANDVNFALSGLFSKLSVGSYDSITNAGLPAIFAGAITLILGVAYFFTKGIRVREKLAAGAVILVMLASLYIACIDTFWHLMKVPTWFPYRYAFLVSFFMLLLAYQAFLRMKKISCLWLGLAGLLAGVLVALGRNESNKTAVLLTLGFTAVYFLILLVCKLRTKYRGILALAVLVIVCVEMSLNGLGIVKGLDSEFRYDSQQTWDEYYGEVAPLVEQTKADESGFFRMDKTFERSKNDALGMGYHGLTHYSSSYNQDVNDMLRRLGFAQMGFWSAYFGSTVVTDSLFDVKYVIADREMPAGYVKKGETAYTLYENPYVLPMAMVADESVTEVKLWDNAVLENQDRVWQAFSGERPFIYQVMDISQQERGHQYSFTVEGTGYVYMSFDSYEPEQCTMTVNGVYQGHVLDTFENRHTLFLGSFKDGEEVTVTLYPEGYISGSPSRCAAVCVPERDFAAQSERLKEKSMYIEKFSASTVKGRVTASQGQVLFTSIPYDESWIVKVDGERVEPKKALGACLCVPLTEGEHTVELRYVPKGLIPGVILTLLAALITGFLCWWNWRKKEREKA